MSTQSADLHCGYKAAVLLLGSAKAQQRLRPNIARYLGSFHLNPLTCSFRAFSCDLGALWSRRMRPQTVVRLARQQLCCRQ